MKITNQYLEDIVDDFYSLAWQDGSEKLNRREVLCVKMAERIMAIIQEEVLIRNQEVDSEFLSVAHMIVSGLKGDLWQITKKDWNKIMQRT